MNMTSEKVSSPAIRPRLERLIVDRANVSKEQAKEFSLHMTDWLQDAENLIQAYASIDEVDDKSLFDVVLKFLLHAPSHIIHAASVMTGEPIEELIDLPTEGGNTQQRR